jgi:uncharacterized protein YndB with AHSA1/START domain
MMQTTDTAVRREITVEAPPERAFAVFTDRFDTWWPRGYQIGGAELAEAIIEPRAGGRWYERGVDGSECSWGEVLAWEPPHRLVLSWRIDGTWTRETDPERYSEIEVTFTALDAGSTRVVLAHSHFERHGAAAALRESIGGDGGWSGLLAAYAEAASAG